MVTSINHQSYHGYWLLSITEVTVGRLLLIKLITWKWFSRTPGNWKYTKNASRYSLKNTRLGKNSVKITICEHCSYENSNRLHAILIIPILFNVVLTLPRIPRKTKSWRFFEKL